MTEDELSINSHHGDRPLVTPKMKHHCIGYAEVINAGKSRYNEDQACVFEGQLRPKRAADDNKPINYLYIGLFDGHGGPGCAVKASKELQQIVHEGLDDALEYIVKAHRAEMEGKLEIFGPYCCCNCKLGGE